MSMDFLKLPLCICLVAFVLVGSDALQAQKAEPVSHDDSAVSTRDGRLFDPGVGRTAAADTAPEELSRLADFLGDWHLEIEIHRPGQEVLKSSGRARVTYMNRGHALLERTRVADFDGQGNSMSTLAFLGVDRQGAWTVGEGNSWSESISLSSGGFVGEDLVLHDFMRPGGGPLLLLIRRTYSQEGTDRFHFRTEISRDLGETWSLAAARHYRRAQPTQGGTGEDFFPVRTDDGIPAPDRPAEGAEFDFLVGEFWADHWMNVSGNQLRWRSSGTGVYVLDGHAILEFDWHGNDPTLPDAATSILRIYNRAMRRWESLYLPNRNHRPLHFGGVREDQRIVLHLFDAQTGPSSVSQWIFYDDRADTYRWKGRSSSDRGKTYNTSWAIHFVRKGSDAERFMSPRPSGQAGGSPGDTQIEITPVETASADGTRLFGDHYRAPQPAATTVVLFHQAGGDARGEYGPIAERLHKSGYEVFAWDVRGGGDRFGQVNRTIAALEGSASKGSATEGYCAAYPDLEAALAYSEKESSGGPLHIVGSSYSAALVFRLAAEHGNLLAGATAFSPASGRMEACAVEKWLDPRPGVRKTPILAFRPAREMENPNASSQAKLLGEHEIPLHIAPDAVHGASMLVGERNEGDTEPTWARFLAFLEDPSANPGGGQ